MDKKLHPPFPYKGDIGIVQNYRGIILTSIADKIHNALLFNRIKPEIEKILKKNQNCFPIKRSTSSQILTIRRIIEGLTSGFLEQSSRNLEVTHLFVDFSKSFDSIHGEKMEQILLAYGLPKETVTAIMMLYKNTKVKVR